MPRRFVTASGRGIRSEEAIASRKQLTTLMMVGHEKFKPVSRQIIPSPGSVDPRPWWNAKWILAHFGDIRWEWLK